MKVEPVPFAEVCPAWFVLFLRGLDHLCAPVDEGFRRAYPEMVLESAAGQHRITTGPRDQKHVPRVRHVTG